jgi:hypothetical protein
MHGATEHEPPIEALLDEDPELALVLAPLTETDYEENWCPGCLESEEECTCELAD